MDDFKLDTEYVGFKIGFRYVIRCNFAIYLLHRKFWNIFIHQYYAIKFSNTNLQT